MAHVTGTASNFNDAIEQIRTALTTNSTLAALSPAQTWTELRYVKANIDEATSNLVNDSGKHLEMMFRSDPRIVTGVDEADSTYLFSASGIVGGSSFIRMKFLVANAVTKLQIQTSMNQYADSYGINGFRLQYSDNDSTWTTVTTVTSLDWSLGETKEFSGWGATGAHLYWRILIDSVGSGATTGSVRLRRIAMLNGSEIVNSAETQSILKGPGLAGADEIFVGFSSYRKVSTSEYVLIVHGFTGFLPTEQSILKQPGVIPYGQPLVALWDAPMPFWFTLSGRRITGVFKVSTVYMGFYAGFILPYATPSQYPYPLAVGGSLCEGGIDTNQLKYSNSTAYTGVFTMPSSKTYSGFLGSELYQSTLSILRPGAIWGSAANRFSNGVLSRDAAIRVSPQCDWVEPLFQYRWKPCGENVGGGYTLWPHIIQQALPSPRVMFGELDGTKQVSGKNNATENDGTVDGIPYVIFQNTFRNGQTEFWALEAQ